MDRASSADVEKYVEATAAQLGLNIAPHQRAGVIANFERLASVAALVNAVPLAAEDEPAPRFSP
jgi:hypothetical protein